MANKSNCCTLAAIIEAQPRNNSPFGRNGFGMSMHFHYCGTPMCISGWAASLNGNLENCDELACEYLGIPLEWQYGCNSLFYPELQESWDEITPARAAIVLRHLGDTGKIDWTVAGLTPRAEANKEADDNE